jgi:hypothetical protein
MAPLLASGVRRTLGTITRLGTVTNEQTISVKEAHIRGYALSVGDCARLLTVHERVVRGMLRAAAGRPDHLPGVRVAVRGHAAVRIRLSDLQDLARRLSLPAPGDAIRPGDAVRILAGKQVGRRTATYMRLYQRLTAATEAGCLTAYVMPGQQQIRYSRSQVHAVRNMFESEGISSKRAPRQRIAAAFAKRIDESLIDSVEAAALAGVTQDAAREWGQKGRYGARRIDGCWFFDSKKIAERKPRAPRMPRVNVECANCGDASLRRASLVRRAEEHAASVGRDPQFFCSDCWTNGAARRLRAVGIRNGWTDGSRRVSSRRSSVAQRAAWVEGRHDRDAAAIIMRRTVSRLLRSPKRRVDWQNARLLKRHGRSLSEDERVRHVRDALSRAQRESDRSRAAREREQRLRELWPTGMTVQRIAEELGTTSSNVKAMRRSLGLAERARGRPRK